MQEEISFSVGRTRSAGEGGGWHSLGPGGWIPGPGDTSTRAVVNKLIARIIGVATRLCWAFWEYYKLMLQDTWPGRYSGAGDALARDNFG